MQTTFLPPPTLAPGRQIAGRYLLEGPAGVGGTGTVYAARDLASGERVALKRLHRSDEAAERAITREAALAGTLRHPQLPVFHGLAPDEAGLFLVMEYIEGSDLGTLLSQQRAPLPVDAVVGWGDRLLELLELLHSQQPPLVHRDIKPQNLKLTPEGRLVLVDFGLAHTMRSGHTTTPTVAGYTPSYAPLEQIQGRVTGPRDDLYAVGATLYHLLAGHAPADALSRAAARINGQPDPLRSLGHLRPDLPPLLVELIHAAMALELERRLPDATTFRAALRRALITPPVVVGPTIVLDEPQVVVERPRGALPLWLMPALGLLAIGAALLLAMLRPFDAAPPAPPLGPVTPAIELRDQQLFGAITALPALNGGSATIGRVAHSSNGRVAAALRNGDILLWDRPEPASTPRVLSADRWANEALVFSPDGALLAAGDTQGRVRLWRAADGALTVIPRKHFQGIAALQFSADGRWLASASSDGAIRLSDVQTGQFKESEGVYNPSTGVTVAAASLAFSPDGRLLILGLIDGSLVQNG